MNSTINGLDMLMGSFATALSTHTSFHGRRDDQGNRAVISSAGLIPLARINHLPTPELVDRAQSEQGTRRWSCLTLSATRA